MRAPGRVNLIGEHTDYQEGLVLPCAIDRATWVAASPRSDDRMRVASVGWKGLPEFPVAAPARAGAWWDYVQGPVAALTAAGVQVPALDLTIASDLPQESGLSSSAALQVAVVLALGTAADAGLPLRRVAEIAHASETDFVGVSCGIMDPFASALGEEGAALRIDCRTRETETVAIGGEGPTLLVTQSGVRRKLADGGYDARVAECDEALRGARTVVPAARALRDVEPHHLDALASRLDAVPLARLRHVVTENARVDAFCRALRAGDSAEAGALLRASMESLRTDFEVSTPELDLLCASADAEPGCHGSRLTGAGFGGCTLHLVDGDAASGVAARIAAAFEARYGRRPPSWVVRPAAGAAVVRGA